MEETQIMAITVEQILAEGPDGRNSPKSDIDRCLKKLRKIEAFLDRLMAAVRMDDVSDREHDWELIYDKIFSREPDDIKMRTQRALEIAGFSFPDYYDPDTSYEEDARAWIDAFREKRRQIEDRRDGRD